MFTATSADCSFYQTGFSVYASEIVQLHQDGTTERKISWRPTSRLVLAGKTPDSSKPYHVCTIELPWDFPVQMLAERLTPSTTVLLSRNTTSYFLTGSIVFWKHWDFQRSSAVRLRFTHLEMSSRWQSRNKPISEQRFLPSDASFVLEWPWPSRRRRA